MGAAAAARLAPLWRALRNTIALGLTDVAAAIAYYAFLAIPAVLLVTVGVFGVVADEGAVRSIVGRLDGVAPDEAVTLIEEQLTRVSRSGGDIASLIGIGALLALWTASGAMSALIRGLNTAHGVEEGRGFVRQRLVAVVLLCWTLLAFLLAFGVLALGPAFAALVGDALGAEGTVGRLWLLAQWPVIIGGLALAFAGIQRLGPNVDHPRWKLWTPGVVVTIVVWLAASAGFAVYVANFGSYDAAWGSVSAVVVMLTWLWITSLAILLGARVDAERRLDR